MCKVGNLHSYDKDIIHANKLITILQKIIYQVSKEKVTWLAATEYKCLADIQTEMLIYQSKANLDEKIRLVNSLIIWT